MTNQQTILAGSADDRSYIASAAADVDRLATTGLPLPCLALDTLQRLPFDDRMRAYNDYDAASRAWHLGRYGRRHRLYGWQFDMHRAMRFWRHYKAAVRKGMTS